MKVRNITFADADAVLRIYASYVLQTAVTFEYDVPSLEEMRLRIANTLQRFPYLVAEEDDGQIVGYAYAGPLKDRAAYQWVAETSIYVERNCRQKGVGRMMQAALEERLRKMEVRTAYACIAFVEEEDEFLSHDSVRFHERMGFKTVGRFHRCGRKFGRWYDILWMEKTL